MSTKRYSGSIEIRITYLDACGETYLDGTKRNPNGQYRCFLKCGVTTKAIYADTTIYVGAPAFLSHGVDSPEAFDDAASAAIAFASHEDSMWSDVAAFDLEGSGYHIGRSPSKAWPKESAKAV